MSKRNAMTAGFCSKGDIAIAQQWQEELAARASGGARTPPPMPKHMPFPDIAGSSELLTELISFCFMLCVTISQFIHIYRTGNWWLPDTSTNHYVNFYLIPADLLTLIMLILARRLLYCLVLRVAALMQRSKLQRFVRQTIKYSFAGAILGCLFFYIIKLTMKNSFLTFFLLIYPALVYLLIFGFQVEPFLRSYNEVEGTYFNDMPVHSCSPNPSTIRAEVELLKNDFNHRIKQALFSSVLNAHYSGFVPCFFATSVHYNVEWVAQHIIMVWLSGFTMSLMFLFPSKYSDILHRSSLHLGQWARIEREQKPKIGSAFAAAAHVAVAWNKHIVWWRGSVVRHQEELYRCAAAITVATPGNTSHARFYRLFQRPTDMYRVLTVVQAALVLSNIALLCFAVEWHFVLSISFITLTNQFTFFKIFGDYLIAKRIYKQESAISDQQLLNANKS